MRLLSGNQRPDLLTSLMNMSLALRLPCEMHLCRSSANVPSLPSFLELLPNLHVLLAFGRVWNPLHLPRKITSERPKMFNSTRQFSSHDYSSLIFSLRLFSSLTLPTSAFPSVHIVGSLTSKLPPKMVYVYIPAYIYIYIYYVIL